MNSVRRVELLAALLLSVAATSSTAQDQISGVSDQFGLGDEFWIAYYEVAPRSVRASMRAAVERECSSGIWEADEWLCGREPLYFVRGVDRWGSKKKTGFVCKGEPPSGKYFPKDMFERHSDPDCLPLSYDSEKVLYVGR